MPSSPSAARQRRRGDSPPPEAIGLAGWQWSWASTLLLFGGALIFLSLMTHNARETPSWVWWASRVGTEELENTNFLGPAGSALSSALILLFGAGSFLLPAGMVWFGVAKLIVGLELRWRPLLGLLLVLCGSAVFLSMQKMFLEDWDIRHSTLSAGGWVGATLSAMVMQFVGIYFTGLIGVLTAAYGFILMFGLTFEDVFAEVKDRWLMWQEERHEAYYERAAQEQEEQRMLTEQQRVERRMAKEEAAARRMAQRNAVAGEDELGSAAAYMAEPEDAEPQTVQLASTTADRLPVAVAVRRPGEPEIIDGTARRNAEEDPAARKMSLAEWRRQRENKDKVATGSGMASSISPLSEAFKNYELPDFDLLHWEESAPRAATDKTLLIATQQIIIRTLASFNVTVMPGTITRGPSITRYEVTPTEGLRVKRIAELEADLARATKAEYINILAPIPGRDTVGIEIVNSDKVPVPLRELLEDPKFTKGKARIPLALGKDVYGETVIADLAAMPHLLVAGTTGSGKSVCINSIIASLLFQFTPDQLRFIMVDPKVVEMQIFNDLPHLIVPVVTEPKKVLAALRWCVNEMEHRYQMFAKEGVKNFEGFNSRKPKETAAEKAASAAAASSAAAARKAKRLADLGPELPLFDDLPPPPALSNDTNRTTLHVAVPPEDYPHANDDDDAVFGPGPVDTAEAIAEDEDPEEDTSVEDYYAELPVQEDVVPEKVPYIVLIIDELADLMQTASADVENEIARLTQKARAAGIHLIVATQTPRANVITGVIKANIPSRIAFQVASGLDSRVILDGNGAEKLVGKGDMLYLPPGTSKLTRVQGAFITDEEIAALVAHCKEQGQPMYDSGVQKSIEAADSGDSSANAMDPEDEELMEKCIEVIIQERIASTSRLQRRLKLGYTRAARMMDLLEKRGVVGPADGIKPREILWNQDDY